MRTKHYIIARHIISLSMDSSSTLWSMMNNYLPFITEDSDGDQILTITVSNNLDIYRNDYFPVLTDRRKQEDIVAFEIYKNDTSDLLIEIKVDRDESVSARLLLNSELNMAQIQLFGNEQTQSFALNRAIMLSYLLATADKETLLMHASVIMNEAMGYLFMGKSGTGKSTHSRLWLNHIPGSELMNDDNPVVRIVDGVAMVFGSPWSGKTSCYRNVSAPIGGFVRLKQAPHNKIRRQNMLESYASLMSSGSGMSWERRTADGKDSAIKGFISKVPCWLLECLPDEDAARLCADTVRKERACQD